MMKRKLLFTFESTITLRVLQNSLTANAHTYFINKLTTDFINACKREMGLELAGYDSSNLQHDIDAKWIVYNNNKYYVYVSDC